MINKHDQQNGTLKKGLGIKIINIKKKKKN